MGRSVWLASLALAIMSFCNAGHSQAAVITAFDEIAGTWAGHANTHDVTLEIDASGRFMARYVFGGESGAARLEGGVLVIPLPEHKGTLQLVRDGDALKGPGLIDGKTWTVSLVRTAPQTRLKRPAFAYFPHAN
jgi:hypothetical protein